MHDEPLLGYLGSAALSAEVIGSTGNGALILAAAGLLASREAAILVVPRTARKRWRQDHARALARRWEVPDLSWGTAGD
jgi:putative intracellular protease/amidase